MELCAPHFYIPRDIHYVHILHGRAGARQSNSPNEESPQSEPPAIYQCWSLPKRLEKIWSQHMPSSSLANQSLPLAPAPIRAFSPSSTLSRPIFPMRPRQLGAFLNPTLHKLHLRNSVHVIVWKISYWGFFLCYLCWISPCPWGTCHGYQLTWLHRLIASTPDSWLIMMGRDTLSVNFSHIFPPQAPLSQKRKEIEKSIEKSLNSLLILPQQSAWSLSISCHRRRGHEFMVWSPKDFDKSHLRLTFMLHSLCQAFHNHSNRTNFFNNS